MSDFFPKVTTTSDEYKYLNIGINWPSNIICICISAISRVQIYSYICLENKWHPNIFEAYWNICSGPFYDICSQHKICDI